jgi:hypothetical protein
MRRFSFHRHGISTVPPMKGFVMGIPSLRRFEQRKSHLTKARQWLLERCQDINYGSITFWMRGAEPDLTRPYRTVRTLKLGPTADGPRSEAASADFVLRTEHLTLLAQIERLPDGTCVKVKVAHGLPGASIDVEEEHKAA